MTGAEGVKVPEPTQPLLGTIKVEDLVGTNFRRTIDDNVVTLTGKVNTITEPWKDFSSDEKEQVGHFIPIQLPAACKGKDVVCTGRVGGDRTVKIDEDLLLVTRMENLTGTSFTLKMDEEPLMTVDFTALIPTGAKAYDPKKTDFGRYGKREQMITGFSIKWDGITATVKGTLKKFTSEMLETEGYYFPIGMSAWYADGVSKKVGTEELKPITDKDVVVTVKDVKKPIKIEYNGLTVAVFDLSKMTLAE